jgi:hypothetical protein
MEISQVQKGKKKKTDRFGSYLEYAGASQSNVQKERSTKNVRVRKASNTRQGEEPCVDLGGIDIEEIGHAIL